MKNFEKYKTVDERANAYEDFCFNHDCEDCPLNGTKPDCGQSRGQFAWLELDADAEEPLPCPCCGNKMLHKHDVINDAKVWLSCGECGYRSPWEMNIDVAVRRHNEIARIMSRAALAEAAGEVSNG